MSNKRKFAKAAFWCLLAFGSIAGVPIDPQDIEDTLRVMNETKIEVILEKGDSPPDLPPLTIEGPSRSGSPTSAIGAAQLSRARKRWEPGTKSQERRRCGTNLDHSFHCEPKLNA